MDRRSFLKALGLGSGASALSACGFDDNRYYTPVEQVLPYVTRPEQATPGTPTFFATTIGRGPGAWPVVASHRDGRVTMVGANKRAPVAAAVPASQLFALQQHYSPDRFTGPSKGGTALAWDAALAELATAVKGATAGGKKVAYLGGYRSGALASLIDAFTGGNSVHWEPFGLAAEAIAAKALFGTATLPKYDLSGAQYVLSFGAGFLSDAWGGPKVQSDYATARNANHGHTVCRMAAVTPLKDQTAANADDWYACAPGAEAQVALAVASLVAKNYKGPGREQALKGDPAAAAAASGLTVEQLQEMADHFAGGHAVALPGGLGGASSAATELAGAVYLLNVVGGATREHFTGGGYPGPVHAYGDVEKLMAAMEAGEIGVLLLGDIDPVYVLPNGAQFAAAMAKVGLTVALSSQPTETAAATSLVLPTSSDFEDWGDEEPWAGFRIVRQPAMTPLNDTRSLGDILLATWRAVDRAAAPTGTWRDHLQAHWADTVYRPQVLGLGNEGEDEAPVASSEAGEGAEVTPLWQTPGFQRWWAGVLADGYHDSAVPSAPLRPTGQMSVGGAGPLGGTGDLSLVVFAHPFVLDGRYANEPWAQETPDPMTGHVWDTWALIHPATAKRLGVGDNDAITVQTAKGSLNVGVEVHPCVREDVVAIPMGGGHTAASGRYAGDVGVNVASLLEATKDKSGVLAWQQAKCSVSKAGGAADLHSTLGVYPRTYEAGSPITDEGDSDRNFAVVVDADELAKHGDAAAAHPGELTGIHHLAMDPRLQKAGITDFYGIPDHPTYRFGMTVDTDACTGCGACVVACYAENNIPVVGKQKVREGREMSWIRVNRYFKDHTGDGSPSVHFVPLMCQQCAHAPCESVCPVLATYHTIDGLNAMIYNRCVGTRYCSNACPYSLRKFNYHSYVWPEPFNLQLNPDVVTRTMGIMEKCTFCVQRIRRTKSAYRDAGFKKTMPDEALTQLTACAEACPSQALTFGNINDAESAPHKTRKSGRNYIPIAEINTFPAVNYLAQASYHVKHAHGAPHAAAEDHGEAHTPAPHGADGH